MSLPCGACVQLTVVRSHGTQQDYLWFVFEKGNPKNIVVGLTGSVRVKLGKVWPWLIFRWVNAGRKLMRIWIEANMNMLAGRLTNIVSVFFLQTEELSAAPGLGWPLCQHHFLDPRVLPIKHRWQPVRAPDCALLYPCRLRGFGPIAETFSFYYADSCNNKAWSFFLD